MTNQSSVRAFMLGTALAITTAGWAQQTAPAQDATPSTPTTPSTQDATPSTTSTPMTKSELKQQHKTQKHNEKAAMEASKAQKAKAQAMKHEDKAQQESEKATPPQ